MGKRSRRQRFAEPLTLREEPSDLAEGRRDLTVRSYGFRAATLNEQNRTVEATMATDQPVQVFDMRTWQIIREVLVMDGARYADQVPLLDSHDRSSVKKQLGSTRNIRKEGGKLVGIRHFSSVADAQEAFTKVREGHLTDGSIGYRVNQFRDLQPGESFALNGREFKNDGQDVLRISHDWTVREDSLTPIGADEAAKVRHDQPPTANRAEPTKDHPMKLEDLIKQFGEKHRSLLAKALADGKDMAAITSLVVAAERAEAEAAVRTQPPSGTGNGGTQTTVPPPVQGADEAARAAGMAAERDRVRQIREAAADPNGGLIVPADLLARAEAEGWTLQRAQTEFLTHVRTNRSPGTRPEGVRVEGVQHMGDGLMRALEAAIAVREMAPTVVRHGVTVDRFRHFRMPDGRTVEDATALQRADQFRGIGLHDLGRLACRAQGIEAPIAIDELFSRAIATVSFPNILGNVLNRVLLAAYEETPSTILEWASTDEVKDFRPHPTLRMGKFSRPVKEGAGGEFDYGALSDAKETRQANTWGIWFGITRQQWINDDLGAFTRVPGEMGAAMRRNVDDIAYTDVLATASGVGPTMNEDGKALFATNHPDGGNYQTGGSSALSASSLQTAKQQMRKIKQGSVFLNLIPRALVVPPELEYTAQQLIQSTSLIGSTTTDKLLGTSNPFFGALRIVVEPRLSAISTTGWYLACEPRQARGLVVSTLRGQPGPMVERRDPQRTLGLGWIAWHDVGVDAVDFRGVQRSAGA